MDTTAYLAATKNYGSKFCITLAPQGSILQTLIALIYSNRKISYQVSPQTALSRHHSLTSYGLNYGCKFCISLAPQGSILQTIIALIYSHRKISFQISPQTALGGHQSLTWYGCKLQL
jgi:hypothetical protein